MASAQPSHSGSQHRARNMTAIDDENRISIAVMGATGSGKSSFINLLSGSKLEVSRLLDSCTQDVQVGDTFSLDGRTVTLIDTPGFDDTERSEVQILKIIAEFLRDHYQYGHKLHGVIYLHRITDIRMGGTAVRTFNMFKQICGEETLRNVVVVTNMWDRVAVVEGERREKELRTDPKFFRPALDQEARMMRHDNKRETGLDIIRAIFKNHPSPLGIQKELVSENRAFADTRAGQVLNGDLEAVAQRFSKDLLLLKAEFASAIKEQDRKAEQELKAEMEKTQAELARVRNEVNNLRIGLDSKDIDCGKVWEDMPTTEKITTLFRRSRGVDQSPALTAFWSALGDTTKTVSSIQTTFKKFPLPNQIQEQLLEDDSTLSREVLLQRTNAIYRWSDFNRGRAMKEFDSVMKKVVERAKRPRRWYSFLFGR